MLRPLFDRMLHRRAGRIFAWIESHLPTSGTLLDIGSGTGHNADYIRRLRPRLCVIEADVVAMTPPGRAPPLLISDGRLPLGATSVDAGMMLYVLHYAADPKSLLAEAARVVRGRLVVLQTTADDAASRRIWRCRDACMGRWPFLICRALGLVGRSECPMNPATLFDRTALHDVISSAGWRVVRIEEQCWPGTTLRRNLIVLEHA